jgi:AbiV family abortive infection protein
MSTSVTPQYLLEGAAYALEQCGLLLRDANSLYRNGSYSSAVALALFAREELGRYQTLLELRNRSSGAIISQLRKSKLAVGIMSANNKPAC